MKFYLKILLLLQLVVHLAHGYIPVICSNNGGICKIEDINQFAVKFMDETSNYVHNGYIIYCKYVCSFIQYVFGTWNNYTRENNKSVVWHQQLWNTYILPIMTWLGFGKRQDDYMEEIICKSSAPALAIIFTIAFCALAVYLRRKPKKVSSVSKLDMSAYLQDEDDELRSNSTFSTLMNTYDHRSCCGCKASISDITERSESVL